MLEKSDRVKRLSSSERSQRPTTIPKDAIRLDMGEPDFPTPAHIQDAAASAMRDNFTHYGNAYGEPALREAICLSLQRDFDVKRSPDNVLVTAGGIEAINVISATYLNPGDEALIPDPEYSAYADSVSLFGGTPVFVPLTRDFHIDFEALEKRISPRTKIVFISSPGNPTGRVLREEEIRNLARLAVKMNLLLVLDEAYHKLIYEGIKFLSICQIEEVRSRAILLNSFSKTYAMTGWRVGYMVAEAQLIKDLVTFHKATTICPNVPAQMACAAAAAGPQDCVEAMRQEYERRKVLVEKKLKEIEGLATPPCEGAFYLFPRFDHSLTSAQMVDYLFSKGIMVRSGTEFGDGGQKHFRISFSTSMEALELGMARLKRALDDLAGK
ncbi:MAG: pyridoxal phosphate-dependent aminotransferase [Hyphomicrobiales bacterium]